MSKGMENFELIENYCEGKLNEEEKALFEGRLQVDTNLKEELELYKNIVAGIKESGKKRLKGKLIEADKELDAETKVTERKSVKPSYLKIFAIAASVMIVVGFSVFYLYFNTKSCSELASTYYEPEKGLPVVMGTNNSKWDEVMNDYKTGNYSGAKSKLEKIGGSITNDTINYFYGVVNYELQNYNDAKSDFLQITSSGYYFEKAQYRLVLTFLKTNDKKSAIQFINEILQNKEHPFYNKLSDLKAEFAK